MRALKWIICCGGVLWPLWSGAEIYQTRDASGNIIYSDRPLATSSRKSDITPPPTGQSPPLPVSIPAQTTETAADDPVLRKARCDKVREILARYQKAEFLSREGADGKSQILSDQEKIKEIELLREQEMAQCDP